MNAILGPTHTQRQRPEPRRYYGKYTGIVTLNKLEDMELPDREHHIGEIEVEVPAILNDEGNGQEPTKVIAKPCFAPGFFFVPEVDSNVWVEFIAGDINHPIWTGSWYPVEGVPNTFDDQQPTELQKIFRTAAGHVIQLDSTEDDEKIVIFHKSETSITIDVDGNVTIEHKGGAKFELKDDTTAELTADTINVIGEITLDGNVQVTGDMKVDGKTEVEGDVIVGTGLKTTIHNNEITGG